MKNEALKITEEKSSPRRQFLAQTLQAAAMLTGAGALATVAGCVDEKPKAPSQKVKVLTPDGKLVEVNADEVAEMKVEVTNAEARIGIPGKKFVMVIDLAKCDGCNKCIEACNKMHYLPPNKEWIEVLKMQDAPEAAPYYFPKPCYHCDNPPCTQVCPVDATFKREDGIVAIDNDRCIGCRFCMAACPYSVRLFNWTEPPEPNLVEMVAAPERVFQSKKGCVEKCDFCPHMAREGKLPGCVMGCPQNAIYFGDQNEDAVTNLAGETERFSQLLEDRAAYRFMEELGTEPRVWYLPPYNRLYPKPEMDEAQPAHS